MTSPPALATELIDDVLIVTIDRPDHPVNTLGVELVDEFENAFRRVDEDTLIQALVLISGKRDGFIAGADIEQFVELRSAADAERLSRTGQDLLNRLETLRVPVVAAIHGACLGGQFERRDLLQHVDDHRQLRGTLRHVRLSSRRR
jgi:3-hydroxyacyl-CoA dehydrogenase/enoyl-CoA hydratase/3-hydroxybutyryl-CoA epimerase